MHRLELRTEGLRRSIGMCGLDIDYEDLPQLLFWGCGDGICLLHKVHRVMLVFWGIQDYDCSVFYFPTSGQEDSWLILIVDRRRTNVPCQTRNSVSDRYRPSIRSWSPQDNRK